MNMVDAAVNTQSSWRPFGRISFTQSDPVASAELGTNLQCLQWKDHATCVYTRASATMHGVEIQGKGMLHEMLTGTH